jgi:hypothetical protein
MADNGTPRLPNESNRTVIIGRTGTGKTVAGLWHLSNYNLEKPWIVYNFKGDEHIASIEKAEHVGLDFIPGKRDRGLFIVNASPYDLEGSMKEPSRVDKQLVKIWERGDCGVFVDETFMLQDSKPLVMLLTQGRSIKIPMILNTQRPVWITRFAFSEASFIQVFDLNDSRDIQTVESFVPIRWDEETPLKEHQSWYYEIAANKLFRFNPVPNMNEIRETFDEKLHKKWVRI